MYDFSSTSGEFDGLWGAHGHNLQVSAMIFIPYIEYLMMPPLEVAIQTSCVRTRFRRLASSPTWSSKTNPTRRVSIRGPCARSGRAIRVHISPGLSFMASVMGRPPGQGTIARQNPPSQDQSFKSAGKGAASGPVRPLILFIPRLISRIEPSRASMLSTCLLFNRKDKISAFARCCSCYTWKQITSY